jgi:hypothetical protein
MPTYTLPATHEDSPYEILPPTSAADAEGNPVPISGLVYAPKSDDEEVIKFIPDAAGDPLRGMTHFGAPHADGSPATAVTTLEARDAAGTFVGIIGEPATFIIGPGAIATVEGGGMSFPNLTPDTPSGDEPHVEHRGRR